MDNHMFEPEKTQADTLVGRVVEGATKDLLADDTLLGHVVNNVKSDIKNVADDVAGVIKRNKQKKQEKQESKSESKPESKPVSETKKDAVTQTPQPAPCDIRLNVPFEQKDAAKGLGAKFHEDAKVKDASGWYAPKGTDLNKFSAYLPQDGKLPTMWSIAVSAKTDKERETAINKYGAKENPKNKELFIPKGSDAKGLSGFFEAHKLMQEEAVKTAERVKNTYPAADPNHPYLQDKKVAPNGILQDPVIDKNGKPIERKDGKPFEPNLIVPLQDINGKVKSFQTINYEGHKFYLSKSTPAECFYPIGLKNKQIPKDIIICEGFATGASIHEATKKPVLCALDTFNLKKVAVAVREKYGDKVNIVIAGDNDHKEENNPGKTKAEEAAAAVKGTAVIPTFTAKEKEAGLKDFNDLAASRGKTAVKDQLSPVLSKSKSAEREIGG